MSNRRAGAEQAARIYVGNKILGVLAENKARMRGELKPEKRASMSNTGKTGGKLSMGVAGNRRAKGKVRGNKELLGKQGEEGHREVKDSNSESSEHGHDMNQCEGVDQGSNGAAKGGGQQQRHAGQERRKIKAHNHDKKEQRRRESR